MRGQTHCDYSGTAASKMGESQAKMCRTDITASVFIAWAIRIAEHQQKAIDAGISILFNWQELDHRIQAVNM